MSRQKSIFCSHLLTLSQSIIFGDSKCLLWQQGARDVKEKGQSGQGLHQTWILGGLQVDLPTFYSLMSQGKSEEIASTDKSFTAKCTKLQTVETSPQFNTFFQTTYSNKSSKTTHSDLTLYQLSSVSFLSKNC